MSFRCPGLTRRLTARLIPCPSCGRSVEIFSDERRVRCSACRTIVTQEPAASCRTWCNGCAGVPRPEGPPRESSDSKRQRKTRAH